MTMRLIIGGKTASGKPLEPESEVDVDPETVEPLPSGEERFERLRRQVEEHSFATYAYDNRDGCLVVDVQTANLLVQVAQALKPAGWSTSPGRRSHDEAVRTPRGRRQGRTSVRCVP